MGARTVAILALIVVAALVVVLGAGLMKPAPAPGGTQPIPPGAAILFESNRDTGGSRKEVYSMGADGSNVTRITYSDMHHFLLGMDPSGRYLVTSRAEQDTDPPAGLGDEDRRAIWAIDLASGNETRLTAPENRAEGDSVSPDGWVVFHMQLAGSLQSDLYKVRLDGTGLSRLTFTEDASECDPAWSPDGTEIAYTCYRASTPRFVLMVMDANGSNNRVVHDPVNAVNTTAFPPGAYDPSWSPDGEWIVFEEPVRFQGENGGAGVWHILKVRPDGSGLTDLSEAGGHNGWAEYLPSFSADGSRIVFSARQGPADASKVQVDVYSMDSEGGSLVRLTSSPAVDDFAVWIR